MARGADRRARDRGPSRGGYSIRDGTTVAELGGLRLDRPRRGTAASPRAERRFRRRFAARGIGVGPRAQAAQLACSPGARALVTSGFATTDGCARPRWSRRRPRRAAAPTACKSATGRRYELVVGGGLVSGPARWSTVSARIGRAPSEPGVRRAVARPGREFLPHVEDVPSLSAGWIKRSIPRAISRPKTRCGAASSRGKPWSTSPPPDDTTFARSWV